LWYSTCSLFDGNFLENRTLSGTQVQSADEHNEQQQDNQEKTWPSISYLVKATMIIALTGAGLYAVYQISNILILVIIAAVIAIGLEPIISSTMRLLHINRGFTIAIAILVGLGLVSLFLLFIVPPLVHQIAELSKAIPNVLGQAGQRNDWFGKLISENQKAIQEFIAALPSRIVNSFGTILGVTGQIGAFIINTITVLVLTIFFINQIPGIANRISLLFEPSKKAVASATTTKMLEKIGSFVSGNLLTSLICTITTYIALLILGIPYSIPLAMWAGFTDLIPQIGAFIGALPAVIIAFYISPLIGIIMIIYFLVYQQVENFLITPNVMQKAVDLSPSSVLIATLIGGDLAGIVGVLLALPITAVLKVFVTDIWYPNTIGKKGL
jgi:predicted PurR-regulated permease PerM